MEGTIICYGDSNTYGYDPCSLMGERYPHRIRWTGILNDRSGWEIRNHGVNGRCIPHDPSLLRFACKQTEDWSKLESPVWLWIMLGTNDLLMDPEPEAEKVRNRMQHFLQLLLKQQAVQQGKIQLRLISPPPMTPGAWVEGEQIIRESRNLEKEYKNLSRELEDSSCVRWSSFFGAGTPEFCRRAASGEYLAEI